MKAHRSLARHAKRSLDASGLLLSEFAILEALLHKGPHLVNDLGRRVDLTSGSITTAVDRLEERGLVARQAHATDRRARVVVLTEPGRALIEAVFARHRAALDATAEGLDADDRATLVELLKRLGTTADERYDAGPG